MGRGYPLLGGGFPFILLLGKDLDLICLVLVFVLVKWSVVFSFSFSFNFSNFVVIITGKNVYS